MVNFFNEVDKLAKMKNGFPETRHPFVPKILKNTASFQVLDGTHGMIAVTLAPKGTRPARQECWDFMNKIVEKRFKGMCEIPEIPENTIALSMAVKNVQVGISCQDFVVSPKVEGHYSFKKLSENAQATYFNDETGKQFLFGICYYPLRAEKPMHCHEAEKTTMSMEFLKAEPYPLSKRNPAAKWYGRYCTSVRAKVLVWTGKADSQIVHVKYNPVANKVKYIGCAECAKDYKSYQLEISKSEEKKEDEEVLEENNHEDDIPDDFDALDDVKDFDALSMN